ncbi:glycosyltransferase family 2 protein [Myxococcus sp. Y35]|uniref:glycosyltransferase family 2 protein n=1 Tax=Pseudomyxococcus flavus TaxID=3115648 RepID=UPI003CF1DC5C
MKPSVSVIIPVHNVEQYIGAAIDSALAQTLPQVEVIVVDDCSTDRTVEVVRRYRDPRVHVHLNTANQGPSQSRNTAIGLAQGAWVAVLDADDWWKPDRLERLLSLAEAQRADIVCDDLLLVNAAEAEPWSTLFTVRARSLGRIQQPFDVSAVKMATDDYGILKPLIRKAFLDATGIRYNPEARAGEDFELLLRCLLASARMVVSHEALYFYRARPGSLVADPIRCLTGIVGMADALIRTLDAGAHGAVVSALEGYRHRKQDELDDARFRVPLCEGRWRECMSLAVKNPARWTRYLGMVAERVLPAALLLLSMAWLSGSVFA